jgi:tungstate transport system substrate-binding protein
VWGRVRTSGGTTTLILAVLAMGAAWPASAESDSVPETVYGDAGPMLRVATGSPGELGLLGALAAAFAAQEPVRVAWYKSGSGAALALLQAGQVDLVMVHAPAAERVAVAQGWAARRTALGGNAYYLVGPAADPAGVRQAADVVDALRRIAGANGKFLTRGDQSGTHRQELALWDLAGIQPDWPGYYASNDFMAASLRQADRDGAYFLTDNSTWVVLRGELANLDLLFSNDPRLINAYHALLAPDGASVKLAARFSEFLAGPSGQAIIRTFGRDRFGSALYVDAASVPAGGD